MKNILLLCLIASLSACTSNIENELKNSFMISNDITSRQQILEKLRIQTCQKELTYYGCAQSNAMSSAFYLIKLKQYPLAIQYADKAKDYHNKNMAKYYPYGNRGDIAQKNCFTHFSFVGLDLTSSDPELDSKNLPDSFSMIYFLALKGGNDYRAKDYINTAYLCELHTIAFGKSQSREQTLQNFLQDSKKFNDPVNQTYVKRFINEIIKPLDQAQLQFSKKYINESNSQLYNARNFSLYTNALTYAQKIGLPQVYQDYLSYYIYLYDKNK
jgi:hypothetical protein